MFNGPAPGEADDPLGGDADKSAEIVARRADKRAWMGFARWSNHVGAIGFWPLFLGLMRSGGAYCMLNRLFVPNTIAEFKEF